MVTINWMGEKVNLIPNVGVYGNGTKALTFMDEEGPFATLTLAIEDIDINNKLKESDDLFLVKAYSENETIVNSLINNGWLEVVSKHKLYPYDLPIFICRTTDKSVSWNK